MDEADFYRACAAILNAEDAYRPRRARPPNRWNNRDPGNGRFPGYGVIRLFRPDQIHVSLRKPERVTRTCRSAEEALALLRSVRARGRQSP